MVKAGALNQERTFWGLERRDGVLSWDGCSLEQLAGEHGTPLYVVNSSLLSRAHAGLRRPFDAEGLQTRLFFSCKTNPVPDVLERIAGLGCGAEIISEFELWLANRLGFRGDDIVVNGTWKSPELLRQAVERGAALVNVESLDELTELREIASSSGRPANVGLRINPCVSKSPLDFTLANGARTSHSGFRHGEPAWTEALRMLRESPQLKVKGLHFHIGTGIRSSKPYAQALNAAMAMWTDLLDAGFEPTVLDIGGGFGVPTVAPFNLVAALRFFGWKRSPGPPRAADRFDVSACVARACARILRGYARERRIAVPTLYLEPGRSLVAASQLLLLRVLSVRTRAGGRPVAVCDAGAMSLSPALLSERHAVLPVCAPLPVHSARYDIVGNLPAPLDVVALGQRLPRLQPGDLIAVMDVGAYFTSLGNNFAGPRLPIVMIENGCWKMIRTRETFEEIVSRDAIVGDPRQS